MLRKLWRRFKGKRAFEGSSNYWENRYKSGGNSGSGSFHQLAAFKAAFLNEFVQKHAITSVAEWGCGDGNQSALFNFPNYVGYDVSKTAISQCQERFKGDSSRQFELISGTRPNGLLFPLTISLDVIYHLVEDDVYTHYLHNLFGSSSRFVIVYSNDNAHGEYGPHVRPRNFTPDVQRLFPAFHLIEHVPAPYPLEQWGPERGSWSEFFVYERQSD
ncbi:MAG: class I SAM-dependent methyltransferase [Flavobacteriales bacterium]|nr:class I SAM-dependent methyltransferase [Flavobacteriales bacterium]